MKKTISLLLSIMLIIQLGMAGSVNAAEYQKNSVETSFISCGGYDTAIEGEYAYVLYDETTVKKIHIPSGDVVSAFTASDIQFRLRFDETHSNKIITVSDGIVLVRTTQNQISGYLIDFTKEAPVGHKVNMSGWGADATMQIVHGYIFMTAADEIYTYKVSDVFGRNENEEEWGWGKWHSRTKISEVVSGCSESSSKVYDFNIQWDGINDGLFVSLPQCWSGNIAPDSNIIIGKIVMNGNEPSIGSDFIKEKVSNLVNYGAYSKYAGSSSLVLNNKLYVVNRITDGGSWYISINDQGLFGYDLSSGAPVYDNLQFFKPEAERTVAAVPFADKAASVTTAGNVYVLDPDNGYNVIDTFSLGQGNVVNVRYDGSKICAHFENKGFAVLDTKSLYKYDLSWGSLFGKQDDDNTGNYIKEAGYATAVEGEYAYILKDDHTVKQVVAKTGETVKTFTADTSNVTYATGSYNSVNSEYIAVENGLVMVKMASYKGETNIVGCDLIDFTKETPVNKPYAFNIGWGAESYIGMSNGFVYTAANDEVKVYPVNEMLTDPGDGDHWWLFSSELKMSSVLGTSENEARTRGINLHWTSGNAGKYIVLPCCWGSTEKANHYITIGDFSVNAEGKLILSTDNLTKISSEYFPDCFNAFDTLMIGDKIYILNNHASGWSVWEHAGVYEITLNADGSVEKKQITPEDKWDHSNSRVVGMAQSGKYIAMVSYNGRVYMYNTETGVIEYNIDMGVTDAKPKYAKKSGNMIYVQFDDKGYSVLKLDKEPSISFGKAAAAVEGGIINVSADVVNSGEGDAENYNFIAAVYNGGKLCELKAASKTIQAKGEEAVSFELNLPENTDNMYVKVMSVDLSTLKPNCDSVKITSFNAAVEQTYGLDVYNDSSKPLCVAFLGGSITEGNMYSLPVTNDFFRKDGREVTYVNAGIGGTGSALGAFRLQNDVLSYNPDVVFIEYSVNDAGVMDAGVTYEAIIRQLLEADHVPVIIPVNLTTTWLQSATDRFDPVCDYYGIKDINVHEYLQSMVDSGQTTWDQLFAGTDGTHPNERLGQIYADYITDCLTNRAADYFKVISNKEQPYSAAYAFNSPCLVPAENAVYSAGFSKNTNANSHFAGGTMVSTTPGSTIKYSFTGTAIGFYVACGEAGTTATYKIDCKHVGKIDCYESGHGDMPMGKSLRYDLEDGNHTIEITVNEPQNNDRTKFEIGYFMVNKQ